MGYPTGYEQLLEAVKSWQEPYFRQKELAEKKATREGTMKLALAQFELDTKRFLLDRALKRSQARLYDKQSQELALNIQKLQDELEGYPNYLQKKRGLELDTMQAKIDLMRKQGDALLLQAQKSGALTEKEKKILEFTQKFPAIASKIMRVATKGDWKSFADTWVNESLPADMLQELKPYYDKILQSGVDSPAMGELSNFIKNKLFDYTLASSGLTRNDLPANVIQQFAPQYNLAGLQFKEPEPKPPGIGQKILGGAQKFFEWQPTGGVPPPKGRTTVQAPGQLARRGGKGAITSRPMTATTPTNPFGAGTMLAGENKKPIEASVGGGIEALKPKTGQQGDRGVLIYLDGKYYEVDPTSKEVWIAGGRRIIGNRNKERILQEYYKMTRGKR